MGKDSGISWTHDTFNPWWGCFKIADECKNCYADATAHRYVSQFGELWGRTNPRRFFGESHWSELAKLNRLAERTGERRRVFVGSMCDWAEIHPVDEVALQMANARERLWREIRECSSLDFLLLTKRPESAAVLVPWANGETRPPDNVWLGVTAGTREALAVNVPILRRIPAVVHFISCEPILEHVSAAEWDAALRDGVTFDDVRHSDRIVDAPFPIDWVIVGDESGHHARPAQVDWIRTAREAALRHGVAFHFKQWAGRDAAGIGGRLPHAGGAGGARKIHLPMLDGKQWAQFPKEH
jgi:protein gp37